jgi:hypothetical protein
MHASATCEAPERRKQGLITLTHNDQTLDLCFSMENTSFLCSAPAPPPVHGTGPNLVSPPPASLSASAVVAPCSSFAGFEVDGANPSASATLASLAGDQAEHANSPALAFFVSSPSSVSAIGFSAGGAMSAVTSLLAPSDIVTALLPTQERFQSAPQPVVRKLPRSIHDVCLELVLRKSAIKEKEKEKEEKKEEEEQVDEWEEEEEGEEEMEEDLDSGILSDFKKKEKEEEEEQVDEWEEEEGQEEGEEEMEEDLDSGILSDFAFLCYLARFALYFPPLCLRQQLPGLGQLAFPSCLLQRFLRGCVVFTAHGLVTAPASVYVEAEREMIWMSRIVARVMSGFVVVPLQAAAAARIEGKGGVIARADSCDVSDLLSYLIADANCVNECNKNFFGSCDKTALHYAAENGHRAMCELLIAGKADVDAKDGCAFTFKICFVFCVGICC